MHSKPHPVDARQGRQHRRGRVPAQHPAAEGVPRKPGVQRARGGEDVARLRGHEGHRQRLLRGAAGVDGPAGLEDACGGRESHGRQGARRRLRQRRCGRGHSDDGGRRHGARPPRKSASPRALEPYARSGPRQQYEAAARHGSDGAMRSSRPRRRVRDSSRSGDSAQSRDRGSADDRGIEYYRFVQ